MNRFHSAAAVVLVSLGGFALPASSQDASSIQQKLEQLKQQREAARQAALSAAAQKPPPPPPTTPPPPLTTPPPPPTVPRPINTAPPPPPPTATATTQPTATTVASASASARPKTVAVTTQAVAAIDKLRSTRQERRHAEVDKLRQRWGDLVDDERGKAELSLHAQRSAYLQRIRGLAVSSNDSKLVESVDQLITQEDRRDADAMNALRSGAK
jgi:hypothetical protein